MTVKREGEVGVGKSLKAKQEKNKRKIVKLESLKQLNLNAAGLDIGAAEIYAAVPEGRDEISVRRFDTFTADLNALADWLEACGVDTVAMESTSVYWIPVYEILEKRGFELYLVNARQVKNAVAEALNFRDTGEMRSGFTTQLFNDRGVHGFTHGQEERKLASENREKAEALDSKGYTRFATAMREFAEQYERQAKREAKRDPFED